MDSDLQRQLSVALEDLDATMKQKSSLEINLNAVEDFIKTLKDQLNTSKEKRKELMGKLHEKEEQSVDNQILQDKTNECENLAKENAVLKNEIQSIVM